MRGRTGPRRLAERWSLIYVLFMFQRDHLPLAKAMRREPTHAEARLWAILRGRKLDGLKFRRQAPVGRYIADFFCAERFLIVEADGPTHDDSEHDRVRDNWLQNEGYRVLRFRNEDVATRTDWVVDQIRRAVGNRAMPDRAV